MKKIKVFLTALVLLAATAVAFAQSTVTGHVTDAATGEPVPFASVMVKGTMNGTASDADGYYTISVPASGVLVYSAVGYKTQEFAPGTRGTVNVALVADTQFLDDVVVVAFGTTTKEAFTGSAAVMKSEDISKHVTSNVTNAMVGSVAGLQIRGAGAAPGSGSGSIYIRGISSLYAGTSPLVIVDGAPFSASLTNIPQGDIESVTVLKDAASAALYGARGAAGVILVTTKKGNTRDAVINVDMKFGVNSRALQEYETINDPGEHYEAYYAQLYNMYYWGQGMTAADAHLKANSRLLTDLVYNVYTYPENEQLIATGGKLNPKATLGRKYVAGNGTEYWLTPDDWKEASYHVAPRQEYSVSMTAGNDRSHLYASVSYLNEDGIIEYSGYQRLSGRIKADYQMKKWLKFGANVAYTHSETTSNPNLGTGSAGSTNLAYYTTSIAPIYPIYIRTMQNGQPAIMTDQYGNPAYDYGVGGNPSIGYMGLTRTFLSTGNPLGSNRYNKVYSLGNQMNATVNADFTFTPWLKLNLQSNVVWGHTLSSDYENALYGPKVGVNGEISKSQTNSLRQNHIQTLTFNESFGSHNVNALIGHEYYYTDSRYLYAIANGGFSPDIQEINAFANKLPNSASSQTEYNVEGYFATASYNYNEKYYANASFRRDATSYFAKDHRWGNFWSVGAAWIVSKENFMSNVDWVDLLKLKASIGQQGNDSIGDLAYIDRYVLSPNATNTGMTPSFNRRGNKLISWETTTNFNVGVESDFFHGRLGATLDVYNKNIKALLFWLSIPEASAGSRGYYGNIGVMRNRGVELVLHGAIVRTRDVQWNASFNISHNKATICHLPESKIADNGGFTEGSYWYKEGGAMYNGFYRESGIDENGQVFFWQDSDLKGATNRPGTKRDAITYDPNNATKYEQGDLQPKAFGGFSTDFNWKGLDVAITFDYQLGGKIYDNRYASFMSPSGNAATGSKFHKDIWKSWTPNNTDSDIPRWQYDDKYTTSASTRFLTNASYLNFQSFTVGYTVPKFWKEISRLRVYVAGENLYFWSARKGLDPRYGFTSNSSIAPYSPVRSFIGGVQITF